MTRPQDTTTSDADDVERHPCPRCQVQPGSPCRSRSGAVAGIYHTGRSKKVARLAKLLRVPTPADRGLGPASIYRALAEHEKRQGYPEAVTQAHTDFAMLQADR